MVEDMSSRTPAEVFAHHMEALGAGDVEAIVADYAEDAIIIWMEGVLHGSDEIRTYFANVVMNVLPPGTRFEVKQQVFEGEIVYILWSAESPTVSVPIGGDTFVIRDGLIAVQTVAAQMIPKGS